MKRAWPWTLVVLAFALVLVRAHSQEQELERLRDDVGYLRRVLEERDDAHASTTRSADDSVSAPRYLPTSERRAQVAAPSPSSAAALPPGAGSLEVATSEDLARAEHTLLTLLDSDRPALRAKLGQVVQEQREALQDEEREQRRERWIARTEAKLHELGSAIGLSDAQRETILHLRVASRDEITDLQRNADSPEAFAEAKKRAREVREETRAKVRALMSEAQYQAYEEADRDDDDDRRPPPGVPPRP